MKHDRFPHRRPPGLLGRDLPRQQQDRWQGQTRPHPPGLAAWHVLSTQTDYRDLGAGYFLQRDDPQRRLRKMISILEGHGYTITNAA